MLEVAAEIAPKAAGVHYELAAARARAGDAKRALAALRLAAEAGFDDAARLRADPAFERLRGDPEFARVLESVEVNHGGHGGSQK
jgi:hypothetical protein